MPPNGNTKRAEPDARPWGKIREILADEVPPERGGKWWALYWDLKLRLEETPDNLALAVPFPNGEGIQGARTALGHLFNSRLGKGAVIIVAGADRDNVPTIFVRRGPNWGKQ